MLQDLEVGDGLAELLALLGVGDGRLVEDLEAADGFGAERGDGVVDDLLDQRQAAIDLADHGVGADGDVLEIDFRRAQAIDGGIVARGDALGGSSAR